MFIESKKFNLPKNISVDYLIVSNNALASLNMIPNHIKYNEIIFDSSNSYGYCERLEKEARGMGKSSFSVLRKGAFVLKL